jgi:hypothetical protein
MPDTKRRLPGSGQAPPIAAALKMELLAFSMKFCHPRFLALQRNAIVGYCPPSYCIAVTMEGIFYWERNYSII